MAHLLSADRIAPIVSGLAGLAWFWAELAPQRTGFEDTDNPATSLRFVAAHPDAWVQAGLALAVAAIALVATVLAMRDRLDAGSESEGAGVAVRTVTVLGLFAAAMLLGMGMVRLAGGPLLHVQGLSQAWGEAAYLVIQFVGSQLLGVGGLSLLALWIAGVGWLGGRRRAIPRLVAVLAILPAVRLLALPGFSDVLPGGFWLVAMAAIPGAFLWLVLLGVSRPVSRAEAPGLAARPATV